MPKIFGTNILGILIGGAAFWMLGAIWYGPVFGEMWIEVQGTTKEAAEARMKDMGVMMYVWGLIISLVSTVGISYVLQQSSASLLTTCAKIAAILAVLIALPIMGYAVLYEGYPIKGLALDFAYVLIGFVLSGAVMSFFRGKDAIDPTT
ncbi:MAG: DUF1761 domain-containing protein [Hellea sp.]|nr:DUF1761 domain-containing protein [Hellea sp.]